MVEVMMFQDTIDLQIASVGAIARLDILKALRAAGLIFPEAMPTLTEEDENALRVTVEDSEISVSLVDGWGEPFTGEAAEIVKKWETAVSQKISRIDPAAVLAAGWREGAEGSVCYWAVSYTEDEEEKARADAERMSKKAAAFAAELFS